MQGDDTDNIITEKKADVFTNNLQKYLTAHSRYSVGMAVNTAFNDITPSIMDTEIIWGEIFMGLGMLAFIALHMCIMLGLTPKARKYRKATEIPQTAKAITAVNTKFPSLLFCIKKSPLHCHDHRRASRDR